jgi:hypothetical protein
MNIFEIIYIIICVIVGVLVLGWTLATGRFVSALVFLPLGLTVMIVFGMRWFNTGGTFNQGPTPWPPMINTCPDFLSYFKRPTGDGSTGATEDTCVDPTGVATAGILQKFPPDGTTNPPVSDNYYFKLIAGESCADKCKRTIEYGLTWEGVTDGETCFLKS